MIINLTQHQPTPEQIAAGVMDSVMAAEVKVLLTFLELPSREEIDERAESLALLAKAENADAALIGGAPYLMSSLEHKLHDWGITPLYSFTERVSEEQVQADGSVKKVAVFKHVGFVQA